MILNISLRKIFKGTLVHKYLQRIGLIEFTLKKWTLKFCECLLLVAIIKCNRDVKPEK